MRVTPAEGRILEALWRRGPMGAAALTEALAAELAEVRAAEPGEGRGEHLGEHLGGRRGERRAWAEATVRTLVRRLVQRGALRAERLGAKVRYAPTLQRSDYLLAESRALLDRLFEGRLAALAAHLAARGALHPDDLADLTRLVKALGGG